MANEEPLFLAYLPKLLAAKRELMAKIYVGRRKNAYLYSNVSKSSIVFHFFDKKLANSYFWILLNEWKKHTSVHFQRQYQRNAFSTSS